MPSSYHQEVLLNRGNEMDNREEEEEEIGLWKTNTDNARHKEQFICPKSLLSVGYPVYILLEFSEE